MIVWLLSKLITRETVLFVVGVVALEAMGVPVLAMIEDVLVDLIDGLLPELTWSSLW